MSQSIISLLAPCQARGRVRFAREGWQGATTVKNTGKSRGGQWGAQRDGAAPAASRAARSRMLRIIGGTWRGRRLRFPPQEEIRPTPDRVRETLFNWLGTRVSEARCLDLFAGSGALGLEALSRGAAHVTFVERDAAAVRELRARLSEWGASGAEVQHADAQRFLGGRGAGGQPFGIVFLDPPFDSDVLSSAARLLEDGGWMAPGAL